MKQRVCTVHARTLLKIRALCCVCMTLRVVVVKYSDDDDDGETMNHLFTAIKAMHRTCFRKLSQSILFHFMSFYYYLHQLIECQEINDECTAIRVISVLLCFVLVLVILNVAKHFMVWPFTIGFAVYLSSYFRFRFWFIKYAHSLFLSGLLTIWWTSERSCWAASVFCACVLHSNDLRCCCSVHNIAALCTLCL